MIIRTLLSVFLLSVAVYSSASAQTYTLGFDQTRYDVAVGAIVDVNLVLTEEITAGQTSRLAAGGDDGLFAYSADTDFTNFNGSARGISFLSAVPDELFTIVNDDTRGVIVGPSNVSFEGVEDFVSNDSDMELGVGGTMVSENVYSIELATLSFNADVDDTATLLELGPHVSGDQFFFLFADDFVPEIIYTQSQIVIGDEAEAFRLSVPEPGSAAILLLVAGIGILKRRKICLA